MALAFYHGHGSPYSWRVWLALEHLGIPYELKVLSFSDKDTTKPEFVAINPRHTVPTITDDDVALWESVVILEYLDERFGMDGPTRLYPGTESERARIRLLVREAEEYLGAEGTTPTATEYFFKGDVAPDADKLAKARIVIADELAYFSRQLKGNFLAGESPTAADFVLYPFVGYVKRITFRKPQSTLTDLIPVPLAQWASRIEALPYFDKTFPPHWR